MTATYINSSFDYGSSDDDDDNTMCDFTEVGIPDGVVLKSDQLEPGISTIGGEPEWLFPIPSSELCCQRCSSEMYLITQFENSFRSNNQRIIYVFCCNTRLCSQVADGWRIYVQEKGLCDETKGKKFWDSLMDDESGMSEDFKRLTLDSSSKSLKKSFPGMYLHIADEIIIEKGRSKRERELQSKLLIDAGEDDFDEDSTDNDVKSQDLEYCERGLLIDEQSIAFQNRVKYYPRQCLRISNSPLLFSKCPRESLSCLCQICSSPLIFEFQLMPAILSLLPVEQGPYIKHLTSPSQNPFIANGMEWVTILVFTCRSEGCAVESANDTSLVFIQHEGEFASLEGGA